MPSQYTDNDLEKLIISYYNKSLLTFTPLFNKYLFVEIIYNSNVLKRFVIDSLGVFRSNVSDDNKETINYLYNMFTIFTQAGKSNSGMEISSGLSGDEYKRKYLIDKIKNYKNDLDYEIYITQEKKDATR